jgi:NOL1/NOP2/fmu family ribosome biogenesis protein
MKRLKLTVIVSFMLVLTGCIQKYNITEQQSDAVAEYMAGRVLKSDVNYDQEMILVDDLQDDTVPEAIITEAPAPTEAVEKSDQQKDTNSTLDNDAEKASETSKEYALSEVIGNKNFDIQYKDYKTADFYPDDQQETYFRVDPRDGYQLLVTSFTVKNISDKKRTLDISEKEITYQLDINVGTVCEPILTLLENDLHYFDMSIGGGKSVTAQLVFEIPKDLDIANMNLIVTNNGKSKIIEIK